MTRNEYALQRACVLCLSTPNYRAGFFLSSHEKIKSLLDFAVQNMDKLGIVMIQHTNPAIYFENGSGILFMRSEITGWEGHKVWIDEAIDIDIQAYLRTRERLK